MNRVTEILRDVLNTGQLPDQWYLDRGTASHSALALELQGKEYSCDERIKGFIQAGKKFIAENKPVVMQIEQTLQCKRYNLQGTPDYIAEIDGKLTICDWKTNQFYWWNKYQLAAYAVLLQENGITCNYGTVIALLEDGNYKVKHYNLKPLTYDFKAMLTVYNIKNGEKKA